MIHQCWPKENYAVKVKYFPGYFSKFCYSGLTRILTRWLLSMKSVSLALQGNMKLWISMKVKYIRHLPGIIINHHLQQILLLDQILNREKHIVPIYLHGNEWRQQTISVLVPKSKLCTFKVSLYHPVKDTACIGARKESIVCQLTCTKVHGLINSWGIPMHIPPLMLEPDNGYVGQS